VVEIVEVVEVVEVVEIVEVVEKMGILTLFCFSKPITNRFCGQK